MARKPRIDAPGVLYHVISRGNNRQALFRADADRVRYLEILAEAQQRFAIRIYAYTLMPNHVHLLLELAAGRLAKCMQVVQQRYAQYVNRKYRRVGHLYQGRYRAIVCERDRYLMALVRYLHLNPVRAKLVRQAEEYLWSSHSAYLGRRQSPVVVAMASILELFDSNPHRARRAYSRFMAETLETGHNPAFYAVRDQQILGSERFAEEVARPRASLPDRQTPLRWGLEELLSGVSRATSIPITVIRGRSRAAKGKSTKHEPSCAISQPLWLASLPARSPTCSAETLRTSRGA